MKTIASLMMLAVTSAAFAAPPPAPTLTVGVTDVRQLEFNWLPVSGAQSYELWFLAAPGAAWVKYREQPAQRAPLFRVGVPVHLLDWPQARYFIKACNWGGCTASNEVGVDGLQLDAIGYFKPPTAGANKSFGRDLELSADGTALVVISSEPIGGVQTGAQINVYRRTSPQSSWRLEARLVPEPREPGATSGSGDCLAISGDGNTIVFGHWREFQYTGSVYVFRKGPDGWSQTQRITLADGVPDDSFGSSVALDTSGRTLVITRDQPGPRRIGTLVVYQDPDDESDQFVHATGLATPPFDDDQWGWCRAIAVSAAGHIARSCFTGSMNSPMPLFTQVFTVTTTTPLQYAETARLPGGGPIAIDEAGTRLVMSGNFPTDAINVWRRDPGGWAVEATFGPFSDGVDHLAISGDGNFIAFGSYYDRTVGNGPLFGLLTRGVEKTGSAMVYERRASGWRLRRFVKADYHNVINSFGHAVALSRNGHVLAVGSPYDASAAKGIDGDREDTSMSGRGAVWLY